MPELLEELEARYENRKKDMELHRMLRDKHNKEAREWADKRDELNKQVKDILAEAKEHKRIRDELNERVKVLKEERKKWNNKAKELSIKLKETRSKIIPRKDIPNIGKLKKKLKDLEFKQQTMVLTPEKERELVELIDSLYKKITEYEKVIEEETKKNKELNELQKQFKEARENAEKYHKEIEKLVAEAQEHHNKMVELFENVDEIRKEADEAHRLYLENKKIADEEHEKFLQASRDVRDFEKIIAGLRQKRIASKKKQEKSEIKKKAEEIYEKFKRGEPLATEDILILQKAGLL